MSIYLKLNDLDNRVTSIQNVLNISNGNLTTQGTLTAGVVGGQAYKNTIKGYTTFEDTTNSVDFQGISIKNLSNSDSIAKISFIDFYNYTGYVDSSIFARHETDGSSRFVFATQPPGAKNADRRNFLVIFEDAAERSGVSFYHVDTPTSEEHQWSFVFGKDATSDAGDGGFCIYHGIDAVYPNPTVGTLGVALKIDRNLNTSLAKNLAFNTGYGIDFSATTDNGTTTPSELFNDYEQGTWTPTYIGSTTAGVVNYGTQIGYYTKIGRMVFINCFISTNSFTTQPTGTLSIGGLPFTVNSSGFNYSPAMTTDLENWNIATIIDIKGKFEAGANTITLRKIQAQGSSQVGNLVGSDMRTTTDSNKLIISGMYWT
jgi:hypothetical protein